MVTGRVNQEGASFYEGRSPRVMNRGLVDPDTRLVNVDEGETPSRMLDDKMGRDDRVSDRSE